jgi:hypothetical protein
LLPNIATGVKYGRNQRFKMQPPAFFYKPDGSGRDSYILSSHGGFIQKYNEYGGAKAFYDNSLRSYAPIILRNSS